jgi:hypothetical protein
MSLLTKLVAPALALACLSGLHAQIRRYAAVDDKTAFHAAVAEQVGEYPSRIEGWSGVEVQLPAAAQQLLRPNVQFARRFTDESTGRHVSVLLIQCRDARDMSGHYPPNCYPANGWTSGGKPNVSTWSLWGRDVPVAEYSFTRREIQGDLQAVVYDFFILPSGAFVTDMDDVRRASGDYRLRPYGAAQFQVVFEGSVPHDERKAIASRLLAPLGSAVDVLTLKTTEVSQ